MGEETPEAAQVRTHFGGSSVLVGVNALSKSSSAPHSSKLQRMSKGSSGVTQKKLVKPGGGGSSLIATEIFTNSTTGFY